MKPLLKIEGLSVRYLGSSRCALKNLSFSVSRGEPVAILGKSGSGKSTLLTAICGLLPSSAQLSGKIELFGAQKKKPKLGKDIAVVFQDPFSAFDPFFSIEYQALEAFYAWRDGTKEEALEQIMSAFGRVGLKISPSELKKYPFQFSGGMLQRASLGLAILHNPSLLLLDEPTSALDAPRKLEFVRLLSSLVIQMEMGMVVATHDLPFALAVCKRFLVVEDGTIMFDGDPKELLRRDEKAQNIAIVNAFFEQTRFLKS